MYSFLILLIVFQVTTSSHILIITPTPSLSHNLFYQRIIRRLSENHQVTSISGDTIDDPNLTNLTEINIHNESYSIWNVGTTLINWQHSQADPTNLVRSFVFNLIKILDATLANPNVRKTLHQQFDLVIFENYFYAGLSILKEELNCPIVTMLSLGLMVNGYDLFGNPSYPSYCVDFRVPAGFNLTFWERLNNFWYAICQRWLYVTEVLPEMEKVIEKHFNRSVNLLEMERNVDLVLVNSNPIFNVPRPLMPAIVEIGGLHLRERKPLPKNLQQYLDSANEGVIYFSLGSNVKSKSLAPEIFNEIVTALRRTSYQILLKWELDHMKNKPDNVHIHRWLPQQDVLDHPNVKLFVTQGGLQSIEEAIRSKVPMVCIPFGGDQPFNARRIDELQIGKWVKDLTSQALIDSFQEVIVNPIYRERISKISDLLWDQPMKPLDRAIWWIEYVIRHKGAQHLRSPAVDLSWFTLLSLDVITTVLIVILSSVFLVIKIVRRLRLKGLPIVKA